jgi:hypothetical protein
MHLKSFIIIITNIVREKNSKKKTPRKYIEIKTNALDTSISMDATTIVTWATRLHGSTHASVTRLRDDALRDLSAPLHTFSGMKRFQHEVQRKHGNMIVGVQIGSFIDYIGVSALIMMDVTGLRAAGNDARCGHPVTSMQSVLETVLAHHDHLAVAVYLQELDPRTGKMTRVFQQVTSRANPVGVDSVAALPLLIHVKETGHTAVVELDRGIYHMDKTVDVSDMDAFETHTIGDEKYDLPHCLRGIESRHGLKTGSIVANDKQMTTSASSHRLSKSLCRSLGLSISSLATRNVQDVMSVIMAPCSNVDVKRWLCDLLVSNNVSSTRRAAIIHVRDAIDSGDIIIQKKHIAMREKVVMSSVVNIRSTLTTDVVEYLTMLLDLSVQLLSNPDNLVAASVSTTFAECQQLKESLPVLYSEQVLTDPHHAGQQCCRNAIATHIFYRIDNTDDVENLRKAVNDVIDTSVGHAYVDGTLVMIGRTTMTLADAFAPTTSVTPPSKKRKRRNNQPKATLACVRACERLDIVLTTIHEHQKKDIDTFVKNVLAPHKNTVSALMTILLMHHALYSHLVKTKSNSWHPAGDTTDTTDVMSMRGTFPPWTERVSTVPYTAEADLQMNKTTIMTAPNGSGKSTYARTLVLTAILHKNGLLVPTTATDLMLPVFDDFHLRMPSADALVDGLSHFQHEVSDMSIICRQVGGGSKSLVVLDEVGSGTCPREGLAMAEALVNYFDGMKATCLFATHLHDLLDNLSELPQLTVTNFSVHPGATRTSRALDTCVAGGLPVLVTDYMATLLSSEEEEDKLTSTTTNIIVDVGGLVAMTRSIVGDDNIKIIVVDDNDHSPPTSVLSAAACVYVIIEGKSDATGQLQVYVGESDNVVRRREEHRLSGRVIDKQLIILASGKTQARQLETRIQSGLAKFVSLTSTVDGCHHVEIKPVVRT